MDRAQKEQFVEQMGGVLRETPIIIVTHNTGLTVAQMSALRTQVRAIGGAVKVTKNRLIKRALEGTSFEGLEPLFVGPTAIAYANDAVAVAKATVDFAKANPKLVLIGGGIGSQVLDAEGIEALAKLPSIEELRSKLLGCLTAPLANTVGVLNAPAQKMVGVLGAPQQKLVGVLRAKEQQAA